MLKYIQAIETKKLFSVFRKWKCNLYSELECKNLKSSFVNLTKYINSYLCKWTSCLAFAAPSISMNRTSLLHRNTVHKSTLVKWENEKNYCECFHFFDIFSNKITNYSNERSIYVYTMFCFTSRHLKILWVIWKRLKICNVKNFTWNGIHKKVYRSLFGADKGDCCIFTLSVCSTLIK